MKTYNYTLNDTLSNTIVSVKADTEERASAKIKELILRSSKWTSLQFLCEGNLSDIQIAELQDD